jgi:hypothetical protein
MNDAAPTQPSSESRRLAGVLLIVLPTVMYGGVTLLNLLVGDPRYMSNPLRQNLWRAGHAHAGVLLVLALIALRYVDEANLPARLKPIARSFIPLAAILMPAGFFLSMVSPAATAPLADCLDLRQRRRARGRRRDAGRRAVAVSGEVTGYSNRIFAIMPLSSWFKR